uniref:Uncharacterized protein n=1 Tax=Opuntia streptacantha TaxID=393608 RepID=A0A7C9B258_OPUST
MHFHVNCKMSFLASFAASIYLAVIFTCAPRLANTLAVSSPIPLAPPVIMAVRLAASIPWVTSSAVEADPNPLFPAVPVTNLNMLTMLSILIKSFFTTAKT